MEMKKNHIYKTFQIPDDFIETANRCQNDLADTFAKLDELAEYNQLRVIKAFHNQNIRTEHLAGSTGYGYDDIGRDALEAVYAEVFDCEDALVRPQITCGTHALALTLFALLRPGDELLCPAGPPYDTLRGVIGMDPDNAPVGNLSEYGISYKEVPFAADGQPDYAGIKKAVCGKTKLALIQRSRGYRDRKSLHLEDIAKIIQAVKAVNPNTICMTDNCYGEFTRECEPTSPNGMGLLHNLSLDFETRFEKSATDLAPGNKAGKTALNADICVGSLIKNPGGGLAPTGGYVAGKKDLVDQVAARLTAPGIGKEVGASLGILPSYYQGLFQAPLVTAAALKSAIFAAKFYEDSRFLALGISTRPHSGESRSDIVQEIRLGSSKAVLAFCKGVQAAAVVDSGAVPLAWAMPGYDSEVVMAAGTFVSGSSIELSADAPMREPYSVFFQGGLAFAHGKLGVLMSASQLRKIGLV